jgi:hypothetical protein
MDAETTSGARVVKADGLRERAADGEGVKAVYPACFSAVFWRGKRRNPTFSGWGFCCCRGA